MVIMKILQKASRVLFYHNGSVSQALIDLFPEIGLEKSKFHHISQGINNNNN